jgi:serine/threonine protein kinase
MFNESLFASTTAAEVTAKFTHLCRGLADLRHPNMVQFLGVCFIQDHPLPVIVTEKLEGSLHSLLEIVANIPMTLKQSLLEDVTRGLHYLHTFNPAITHGALTARNVLYTSSLVAKISDICNNHLVQLQCRRLAQALTLETLSYMPKDAASQSSPKTDVFSFGHLALFTLTQVSVLMTT